VKNEITYDTVDQTEVTRGTPAPSTEAPVDGGPVTLGCHSKDDFATATANSGNAEILETFAKDYPVGPHDKPQSMCPAFGSLRVGLRMKRVATLLSGSACCVYGLSFVSHFYAARRSVGYVPFDSESLVTGKLFEDIREATFELADPEKYDAIVVTNLCVPTASGVPLRLLPPEINGVRVIGIDVPGFGIPTHAEAKDVLAGAMLSYARQEVTAGPVKPMNKEASGRPRLTLLGEMFPADPMMIGAMIAPLGLEVGTTVPCREWRELYSALDCAAVAAIHPFYTAAIREFEHAGRPVFGSAPVGKEGTNAWFDAIGDLFGIKADTLAGAKNAFLPAIEAALQSNSIKGRITVSGYEGSELLVARLLVESGAEVPYVGTACPKTPYNTEDAAWLAAKGCVVKFRASLEDDCAAVDALAPDLAIGTTPVVQHAKERNIPSLYFTNLISARPLMGVAGAGSLAQVINAALAGKSRMEKMSAFFDGVGQGDSAGIWEGTPNLQPEFRALQEKKRAKAERAAKAQEMI
jgi:chlorophyllide a reductase subunit Y